MQLLNAILHGFPGVSLDSFSAKIERDEQVLDAKL
jgi:hypothetical protein